MKGSERSRQRLLDRMMFIENKFLSRDNDIYFLEVIEGKVLINDNYNGLLLMDSNFNLLKKYEIDNDLIIDFYIKKDTEILLFCYESERIVYISLEQEIQKVISLKGYEMCIFSELFEWNTENIILFDYKGNVFSLSIENAEINIIKSFDLFIDAMMAYKKLKPFHLRKMFSTEKKAIIEDASKKLSLIGYDGVVRNIRSILEGEFHDFEISDYFIAEIGENETVFVEVAGDGCKRCRPDSGYCFLRGKFLIENQRIWFYLLSGDKSDVQKNIIYKYELIL